MNRLVDRINSASSFVFGKILMTLSLLMFLNFSVITHYFDLSLLELIELCEEGDKEEEIKEIEEDSEINRFYLNFNDTESLVALRNFKSNIQVLTDCYSEVFTPPPEQLI